MRILILTASVGSGHVRAAQALQAALQETEPEAHIQLVDVLDQAGPAFRLIYRDGYLGLANRAPHLLGGLYDATDREQRPAFESLRRRIQELSLRRLTALVKEGRWDLAVSTHFLPPEILAGLKLRGEADLPQAVVVTDFHAHKLWAQLPCERFIVAGREAAEDLRGWGVDPGCISETGIPIDPAFATVNRRAAPAGLPSILLLSGGAGLGPVERSYEALLGLPRPCRVTVVAGRNERLRRRLARVSVPTRHRAQVLGFTKLMPQLMADSDIVVTKPGGLTVSEALASGAALLVTQPVPGQESRNCDYLLENGAAVKADGPAQLAAKTGALLEEPGRLARLRLNARILGKPRSAQAAAREVLELARLSAEFSPRAGRGAAGSSRGTLARPGR